MSYNRPPSPSSSTRRIVQPGRTSAGSFFTPSYHDYAPPFRASRDHVPLPRVSGERVDAPRVIPIRRGSPPRRARDDDYNVRPRRMSLDPGDPLSRRPLSVMPPRSPNRSARPVITKDLDRPSSPLSKPARSSGGGVQEVASYVIPASSSSGRNHHRHSSLTTGDRLRPLDREPRERTYPGGSRTSALRPRADDRDDREYNYEYTGPKKEFLRDGAPPPLSRARDRRESFNSGGVRPTSMIVPDRTDPEYRRLNRDMGPPLSTRGFNDNLGRSESLRQPRHARDDDLDRREPPARGYLRNDRDGPRYAESGRPSRKTTEDDYVPYPEDNTRHSRPRKPIIEEERLDPRPWPRKPTLEDDRLDPKSREYDDQHARAGEDRSRRHHDRDHERRRDYDGQDDKDRRVRDDTREKRDRAEDDGTSKGLAAGGAAAAAAATAATAGLVAEGARRHRHKESKDDDGRSSKDPQAYLREPGIDRDSESTSISGETRLSGGPEDEDKEERRRRRRREREREEREYLEARDHDRRLKEDPTHAAPKEIEAGPQPGPRDLVPPSMIPPRGTDAALREQKSYERRPSDEVTPRQHRRHHHHRRHHTRTREEDSYSDPSSASSEETDEDDRVPRNPRVVTPSPEEANKPARPPAPPKGILKKAKPAFPEPPNPVREGVAPLDAAKKGIPPEARWTRINRRLVNPEALEQEGVRFEEYPEYVIVLKVLNQEEISRYAQKTHEIREKRRLMMGAPPGSGEGEISDRS